MKTQQTVRRLFNDKAPSWSQKYAVNGALVQRLDTIVIQLIGMVPPRSRVLDLGCGTGAIAAHLANEAFQVYACDIADKMIDEGKRLYPSTEIEWTKLQSDWKILPFPPGYFDAIVAASVLEYVEDPVGVLEECSRTLKPGGKLLFTIPNPKSLLRQVEKLLRPVAVRVIDSPLARLNLRVKHYLTYLIVSSNRFSVEQWEVLAKRWSLSDNDSHRERHIECGKHMLLLCVEKDLT